MNRHILEMIFEFNHREEALKDPYISEHIAKCNICNELFEKYFSSLELLRGGKCIPKLKKSDSEEIFNKITENRITTHIQTIRALRFVAIAVVVIIFIFSTIYFIVSNSGYEKIALDNLPHILTSSNEEEIEIITNMELYSNLEIIEHLEELEYLREVLEDEI